MPKTVRGENLAQYLIGRYTSSVHFDIEDIPPVVKRIMMPAPKTSLFLGQITIARHQTIVSLISI